MATARQREQAVRWLYRTYARPDHALRYGASFLGEVPLAYLRSSIDLDTDAILDAAGEILREAPEKYRETLQQIYDEQVDAEFARNELDSTIRAMHVGDLLPSPAPGSLVFLLANDVGAVVINPSGGTVSIQFVVDDVPTMMKSVGLIEMFRASYSDEDEHLPDFPIEVQYDGSDGTWLVLGVLSVCDDHQADTTHAMIEFFKQYNPREL